MTLMLQLSTYALTIFRKRVELPDSEEKSSSSSFVDVDFWDTAGQEAFAKMHPSYYYRAHCCILTFDVTRKITYTHLADWYKELREYCPNIPCIVVANKIDVNYEVSRWCMFSNTLPNSMFIAIRLRRKTLSSPPNIICHFSLSRLRMGKMW